MLVDLNHIAVAIPCHRVVRRDASLPDIVGVWIASVSYCVGKSTIDGCFHRQIPRSSNN